MSNGRGFRRYSHASQEKQWQAFERLPRSVRDVLNDAACKWAPWPIWLEWNSGKFKDGMALAREIKARDRREVSRRLKALRGLFSLIVVFVLASLIYSEPAAAQGEHCQCVCYWHGNQRVCRWHCTRTYHIERRYVPQQTYQQQYYYYEPAPEPQPTYQHQPSYTSFPDGFGWAIVGLIILGLLSLIPDTPSDEVELETEEAEDSAETARELAERAENQRKQIDRFLADALRQSAKAGRLSADKEKE